MGIDCDGNITLQPINNYAAITQYTNLVKIILRRIKEFERY